MIFRRTILKQDLAIKLYPQSSNINAAMQLLRKEIKLSPELNNKLDLLTKKYTSALLYIQRVGRLFWNIFVSARKNLSCYKKFFGEIMIKHTVKLAKTSLKVLSIPINR